MIKTLTDLHKMLNTMAENNQAMTYEVMDDIMHYILEEKNMYEGQVSIWIDNCNKCMKMMKAFKND